MVASRRWAGQLSGASCVLSSEPAVRQGISCTFEFTTAIAEPKSARKRSSVSGCSDS